MAEAKVRSKLEFMTRQMEAMQLKSRIESWRKDQNFSLRESLFVRLYVIHRIGVTFPRAFSDRNATRVMKVPAVKSVTLLGTARAHGSPRFIDFHDWSLSLLLRTPPRRINIHPRFFRPAFVSVDLFSLFPVSDVQCAYTQSTCIWFYGVQACVGSRASLRFFCDAIALRL